MMLLILLLALLLGGLTYYGERRAEVWASAARGTGGDPAEGRVAIVAYGCVACHTIPGVRGGDAKVGPPLAGIASRFYIGGVLPNAPGNMIRWVMDPQAIDDKTAMPNVGVTATDARHIAAYLYTLR
jgi:cytochrome c2